MHLVLAVPLIPVLLSAVWGVETGDWSALISSVTTLVTCGMVFVGLASGGEDGP